VLVVLVVVNMSKGTDFVAKNIPNVFLLHYICMLILYLRLNVMHHGKNPLK